MKTANNGTLKGLTAALIMAAAIPVGAARPNILHIHADDHRADGLRALGNDVLQTPNLDTLVERGMTFTRCYTMGSMVGAVCLPSRTMMLTGRALFRIPGRGTKDDEGKSLASVINAAGYQTWHMGKGGNEYTAGLRVLRDEHP